MARLTCISTVSELIDGSVREPPYAEIGCLAVEKLEGQ